LAKLAARQDQRPDQIFTLLVTDRAGLRMMRSNASIPTNESSAMQYT
jgi:hypothetical protein